jgi:hypothetical protein
MIAAIALGCSMAIAHAVEVPGPDGNPGNLARLLQNPAVLQDLGLTDKQIGESRTVSKQVLEKHRQQFADAWALGGGPERRVKVGEVFLSVTEETFAGLEPILSPAQLTRLRQLELQFFGARAFGRPTVIKELRLTPEQREDFQQLATEYGEKLGSAFGDQTLTPHQRDEKRAALRAEVASEIRKRLDEEQRSAWDKMMGKPFQPRRD